MGSGCTQASSKKSSCFTKLSDECVVYTGEPIPSLGVCTGDTGGELFETILTKLLEYAEGDGIVLSDITANCDYVTNILANKDKELSTLIQVLFDTNCSLNDRITALETETDPPYPFSLQCLTAPTTVNRDTILQATIDQTCLNTTSITNILNQLATDGDGDILNSVTQLIGNFILDRLSSCQGGVVKTGSGATAEVQFNAQVPIRGMVFGDFNVGSFDNTGKGLASAGMCNFAVANGLNGTVDMRGFTAAMSNSSTIPGGSLNAIVQPGIDPDLQNAIGSRKGSYKVTLTSSQLPNHSHTVTQIPHTHTYNEVFSGNAGNMFPNDGIDQKGSVHLNKSVSQTSSETVNLTVGGLVGGSGVSHENRPPTYYGIWIQRIS